MRNLIQFILRNTHWLLFLVLLVFSIVLLTRNNQFQRSGYLSVAQEVSGRVYTVSGNIESYIHLKKTNEELISRIAELENQVHAYREQSYLNTDSIDWGNLNLNTTQSPTYNFTSARVIYNKVSGLENYITLDKGSKDGIRADMGVLSAQGIVGVVMSTSPHFSLVIPVLNPKFGLSCKVKNTNSFGPLVWDGKNPQYTYLRELPRHISYEIGDTIVTSGFSSIFPEGLPVGVIENWQKQKDDNYNSLRVKLFTDFNTLTEVLIVENSHQEEQRTLQEKTNAL